MSDDLYVEDCNCEACRELDKKLFKHRKKQMVKKKNYEPAQTPRERVVLTTGTFCLVVVFLSLTALVVGLCIKLITLMF